MWQDRKHDEEHACPFCGAVIIAVINVPQTGFGDENVGVTFYKGCEHLTADGMAYSYTTLACSLEQAIRDCFRRQA